MKRAMNESHKVMLGRFFDERVSVLLRASLDDYCSEDRIVSMIDSQLDDLNDHRPMFTLKSFVFCHYSLNEIKEDNNIETSSQVPRNEVMTVILRTIVDTHIRCISGIDNLLLYG